MVFHGTIQNGVVVLDAPVELPEGAAVRMEVFSVAEFDESKRRRGGQWKGQVRISDDFDILPDDLAEAFGVRAE